MTDCGSCSGCGNASGCTGCSNASTLELTGPEVALLRLLGQVAFLPVARKLGEARQREKAAVLAKDQELMERFQG